MGQKHTIITADQPLYSRGHELVWANPKFAHVIFIMGGLHICFSFLKAMGKHMEKAGLDDTWTEAGICSSYNRHNAGWESLLPRRDGTPADLLSSMAHLVANVWIMAG